MYFCYGYSIDVYLDWFPKYLYDSRGVNLKQMGFYASLPFVAGAVGNLLGGWLSDLWAARTGNLTSGSPGDCGGWVCDCRGIDPARYLYQPHYGIRLSFPASQFSAWS